MGQVGIPPDEPRRLLDHHTCNTIASTTATATAAANATSAIVAGTLPQKASHGVRKVGPRDDVGVQPIVPRGRFFIIIITVAIGNVRVGSAEEDGAEAAAAAPSAPGPCTTNAGNIIVTATNSNSIIAFTASKNIAIALTLLRNILTLHNILNLLITAEGYRQLLPQHLPLLGLVEQGEGPTQISSRGDQQLLEPGRSPGLQCSIRIIGVGMGMVVAGMGRRKEAEGIESEEERILFRLP